ncbi:MAG: tRNA-dihydrouridine synthase family protein [Kiritimatiellae bacterium]|nr:tRNA-dihydrouridine synthase family protein [Kiritimatiellia bacterium]
MKCALAPLAGFTDAPFRRLCAQLGADLTYTEMVSAAGLAHGSSPTRHLMELLPGEGPVACQLFGSNPEELAFAAHEADATGRFVEINLNAGCPVPRIVHEGAGAALVKKPELVHELLKAMVRETKLPVTLKTRPGPRPDRVLLWELLDAAETAGASGITLHARFTSQNHGGDVHLDLLAELVRRAKIPVGGNGGVVDATTARAMAETGVDMVMIGRGAVARPWIFRELKGLPPLDLGTVPNVVGTDPMKVLFSRHLDSILEFRDFLAQKYPRDHVPGVDGFVSVKLHTHLFRYFAGRPGAGELRRRLNAIRTLAEVRALLADFP